VNPTLFRWLFLPSQDDQSWFSGERSLTAIERLMVMLLIVMAVKMMLTDFQSLNLPA
jgi:small neutral amino acid transporter SnatA (MarC family)